MYRLSLLLVAINLQVFMGQSVVAQEHDVREVIEHCEYKNPGQDQQSILSITLIDKDGNERKNVYQRLWKNYNGQNGIVDKMVLYTQYPPDAKGTGFMRWGYQSKTKKMADQWLYLPHLRKVRRVSVRDPGDSFLGSDLTYGDIENRSIDDESYTLLKNQKDTGLESYLVEITPKEDNALYSKKVSLYTKKANWDSCLRVKTDYYDRQGNLLKKQSLTWQKIENAWIWDQVTVENVQTNHKSKFVVTSVSVNVGLKDRVFTERALKKGL